MINRKKVVRENILGILYQHTVGPPYLRMWKLLIKGLPVRDSVILGAPGTNLPTDQGTIIYSFDYSPVTLQVPVILL